MQDAHWRVKLVEVRQSLDSMLLEDPADRLDGELIPGKQGKADYYYVRV